MLKTISLLIIVVFAFSYHKLTAQTESELELLKANHNKEVTDYRNEYDASFRNAEESPLLEADLANFQTHNYYTIDYKYRIEADFILNENPVEFEMPTTTERKPIYLKYGEAHFTMDGEKIVLELYRNVELAKTENFADYLFLPFTDKTTGFDSYGGGRYVDCKIPAGNKIIIDFNYAYNPYCAFNHRYSCPLPPAVNHIPVKIEAGEKKFH